jgi:hypothetical protein
MGLRLRRNEAQGQKDRSRIHGLSQPRGYRCSLTALGPAGKFVGLFMRAKGSVVNEADLLLARAHGHFVL